MPAKNRIALDGTRLSIGDVVAVARAGVGASLGPMAVRRMRKSRAHVEVLVDRDDVAYGITTGFGEFSRVRIPKDKIRRLQLNLVRSHAVGVGPPLSDDVVRAAILIRANTLARGHSGIRPEVVEALLAMLDRGVLPEVPEKGSLGASGDLAPLAHLVLPLLGEGHARMEGRRLAGAEALSKAGLKPIVLEAKEGLALLNGTAFMAAIGCLAVHDAYDLMEDAQLAGAITLEALLGTDQIFRSEVGRLRPHPGHVTVAENVWRLLRGSEILRSHKDSDHRVQDAYALRCMPQVLGASLDVVRWAEATMEREINSVTDNPLILDDGTVLSAGNFHGQPLAFALDFMAIALSEVANIAERRIDRLVNPHVSEMQPFLVESGGINSGFMVAQYTAAALVSENKVLCHPASVDSIPTSANQEDHVSMGMTAALKLRTVVENTAHVVAIEYMTAAQGLDLRTPLKPGKGLLPAYRTIRSRVTRLVQDRVLAPDVHAIRQLMREGAIRRAVAQGGIRLARRPGTPLA